jgi:hypothetical protein
MQTPVASAETKGGRSAWLWGMPFLTAALVAICSIKVVIWNKELLMRF